MFDQGKTEDGCLLLYAQFSSAMVTERSQIAELVFRYDPDIVRLTTNLESQLLRETDIRVRSAIAETLASVYVSIRDFAAAQRAFTTAGPEPRNLLRSAELLLFLGQPAESERMLMLLLNGKPDARTAHEALATLIWKYIGEGAYGKAIERLGSLGNSPEKFYLSFLAYRGLGEAKAAEESRIGLKNSYPNSVYTALIDGSGWAKEDPAVVLLLGLQGLGFNPSKENRDLVQERASAIQVGYFRNRENAEQLSASLNAKGFISEVEEDQRPQIRYKVIVVLKAGQDAQTILVQLKDQGLEGFLVF